MLNRPAAIAALQNVLQYLEHPDVQSISFVIPASSPARQVREMIKDLQAEQAAESALLEALKITAPMLNWSWVRDAFIEHGYQAQYHTMQEQNRAAIAKAEKE